jgi:hypothetical protein
MNFFYMTSDGRIHDCWKLDNCYVSSLDISPEAFEEARKSGHPSYHYDEKLSDICLWLAENVKEFSVGVCFGMEHGEAVEYKYEIFILDDEDAVQFKLIWA